jgi:hypothetical protein
MTGLYCLVLIFTSVISPAPASGTDVPASVLLSPYKVETVNEDEEIDPLERITQSFRKDSVDDGFSFPFDLSRLLPFSALLDNLELPGNFNLDIGLKRIGIGCSF